MKSPSSSEPPAKGAKSSSCTPSSSSSTVKKVLPEKADPQKSKPSTNLKSGKPSPPTMVRLEGVRGSLSHSDVVTAVEKFGKTKSVVLFRSRVEAIVCFEREEDAKKLKSLKSIEMKGMPVFVVGEKDPKEDKKPPQKKPNTPGVSTPQTSKSTTTSPAADVGKGPSSSEVKKEAADKPAKQIKAEKGSDKGPIKPECKTEKTTAPVNQPDAAALVPKREIKLEEADGGDLVEPMEDEKVWVKQEVGACAEVKAEKHTTAQGPGDKGRPATSVAETRAAENSAAKESESTAQGPPTKPSAASPQDISHISGTNVTSMSVRQTEPTVSTASTAAPVSTVSTMAPAAPTAPASMAPTASTTSTVAPASTVAKVSTAPTAAKASTASSAAKASTASTASSAAKASTASSAAKASTASSAAKASTASTAPAASPPASVNHRLTTGEMLDKHLVPKKITCLNTKKCVKKIKKLGKQLLMISELPPYQDGSYTEEELAQIFIPFGFEYYCENIYVVPQACMAFLQMPTAESLIKIIKDIKPAGVFFKGTKVTLSVVHSGVLMTPFGFYKSVMKKANYAVNDSGRTTVFITNLSLEEAKALRGSLRKISCVKNYLPLLNKAFVEFKTIQDADRLGVWYGLLKQVPGYSVYRLATPPLAAAQLPCLREKALPDSKDMVDGVVLPPVKHGVPEGSLSPCGVTMKKYPFLYPTMGLWFIIPDHLTPKTEWDIPMARGQASRFNTVMLTGLPEGGYRHEDVAELVWSYFPKQNLSSLYYNVRVLPLQRRAFVFFPDWTACSEFVRDHLRNPFSVKGFSLSVHFILEPMNSEPSEEMMYRSLMKWSNAGDPDPEALEDRLLCVEISEMTVEIIRMVMEAVASITTFVNFLPLSNRICVEMAKVGAVKQVLGKWLKVSQDYAKKHTAWRQVLRCQSLKNFKQRLQLSSQTKMTTLKPDHTAVKPKGASKNPEKGSQIPSPGPSTVSKPTAAGPGGRATGKPAKKDDAGKPGSVVTAAPEAGDGSTPVSRTVAASSSSSSSSSFGSGNTAPPPGDNVAQLPPINTDIVHALMAAVRQHRLTRGRRSQEEGRADETDEQSFNMDDFVAIDEVGENMEETSAEPHSSSSSSSRARGRTQTSASSSAGTLLKSSSSSSSSPSPSTKSAKDASSSKPRSLSAKSSSESKPLIKPSSSAGVSKASSSSSLSPDTPSSPGQKSHQSRKCEEHMVEASRGSEDGNKQASRSSDEEKKKRKDQEVEGETLQVESCRTSNDEEETPAGEIPNEDQPLQDPDDEETDQDTFEILDSIDDETVAEEDGQRPETQGDQTCQENTEEEEDAYQVIDSFEDQSTTTETEPETDDKKRATKKRQTAARKDDRPSTRSSRSTTAATSDEKSPKTRDRTARRSETQTKMDAAREDSQEEVKDTTEETLFEVVDSVEDEPVQDVAATEKSNRRRSARGKKGGKVAPNLPEEPQKPAEDAEASFKVLDSVEDENVDDEPNVSTRSTRGRRARTSKKDASSEESKKEETPSRRRIAPARETQELNKEATPKTDEKDPTLQQPDSVEDEAVKTPAARGRRGRPKKAATKKGSAALKKKDKDPSEKVADEDEVTYQILDSVEDEPAEDQPPTGPSESADESEEEDKPNNEEEPEYQIVDSLEEDQVQEEPTVSEEPENEGEAPTKQEGGDPPTCGATPEEEEESEKEAKESRRETADVSEEGRDDPSAAGSEPRNQESPPKAGDHKDHKTTPEKISTSSTLLSLDKVSEEEEEYPDDREEEEEEARWRQGTTKERKLSKQREERRPRSTRGGRGGLRRTRGRRREDEEVDAQELVTLDEVGADEAGEERAPEGELQTLVTLDEFVGEEEEEKQSWPETRPLRQDDQSEDSLNPETLVTLDEVGGDEEEKQDEERAEKPSRAAKRSHRDDTEENVNFVTLDEVEEEEEEQEVVSTRTRGRPKKRPRKTPVRKSTRGKDVSTKPERGEDEEEPADGEAAEEATLEGDVEEGEEEEEEGRSSSVQMKVASKQRRQPLGPEAKRSRSQSPRVAHDFQLPPFKPNNPLGQEFVVPQLGYLCNICSVFYLNERTAKELHCSSQKHYDNLQKYYQKLQEKPPTSPQGSVSE